tara:strand:- start:1065 stop:1484 length:420 start_codon:yes stop_codon:yes gene_type:complete
MFSLFDAIILVLLMNTINDYSKISAESTSSRFATVSAEEAFVSYSHERAGVLKWSKRELVRINQFGGGDVDTYVVPVEGEIDKEKIKTALDKKFPRQSSSGQLRWFAGIAVLVKGDLGFEHHMTFKNHVTVEQHYGICD